MSPKHLILHIGFPKTGTKTLQKHLFHGHSGINYFEKELPFYEKINDEIYYSRENFVDRKIEDHKFFLKNMLKYFDDQNKPFILSNESFTSFSMFFRFRPIPYIWTLEPNSVARKLHSVFVKTDTFNNIKILIVIRRQDEMLKSIYAQVYNLSFKRFHQTKTFNGFLNYSLEENSDQFICDSLHYENIIRYYESLFGEDNVGVFVFEELRESPNSYFEKISNFLQIDPKETLSLLKNKNENRRSSYKDYYPSDSRNLYELLTFHKDRLLGYKSLGLKNSLIKIILKKIIIPGRKLKEINYSNELQKRIINEFAQTNKALSDRRTLNLNLYGYY